MYTFMETQNINSVCRDEKLNAKTLIAAKREAARKCIFEGTVLKLFQNGCFVAYKEGGVWINL